MNTKTPKILVLGTNNLHKLSELTPHFADLPLVLRTAAEYGDFAPVEDGDTLETNALLKARAALKISGEWSVADDTGLEVDALDGRPGLYAARYAGPRCSYADNVAKLLRELKQVPLKKRRAAFICCVALCRPEAEPEIFKGVCEGVIAEKTKGEAGFGYDPVFVPSDEYAAGRSFAEMSAEDKNLISHRGLAVRMLHEHLRKLLRDE